ncbi:MAG: hypothetical protein O9264_07725 [Leptospira sp.]|nr:hypothetical protein [Leptospira sp.]
MKQVESCGSDCSKSLIRQQFAEGKEIDTALLLSCDACFQEYVTCEEAVISLLPEFGMVLEAHEDPFPSFYEALDLAKAESALEGGGYELPGFLKAYTEANLSLPEKKDQLLIRLTNQGMQVIQSFLETVKLTEAFTVMPSYRSPETDISGNASVIFQETVSEDQTFYYQIVKETTEEVYLSVKAESRIPGFFHQVNLRKDGRFILSNKIGLDGMASFSNLKAGNYTIEFQGENHPKSFDLSILVG